MLKIVIKERKTAKLFSVIQFNAILRHSINSNQNYVTQHTLACYIIRHSTQNNLPWLKCIPQWPSFVWFGFGWAECCTMTTNNDQWHLRTMAWPYKVITLWLLWLAEEMGWHDESGRQDCLQPCSPGTAEAALPCPECINRTDLPLLAAVDIWYVEEIPLSI